MGDLVLDKATKVAEIETTIAEVWLDAYTQQDFPFAHDAYHAGLLAEHYISFLPDDPAQWTVEQSAKATELLNAFNEIVHKAGLLRGKVYGR